MAYIMDTNEDERVKGITVEVGQGHGAKNTLEMAKYGKNTTGESWDIVVDEESYYEKVVMEKFGTAMRETICIFFPGIGLSTLLSGARISGIDCYSPLDVAHKLVVAGILRAADINSPSHLLLWIELIDITNKSVKNLVFSGYDAPYIYFVEINALYIVSLTIEARLPFEKLLLLNVSLVTKVELDYYKALFDDESLEMYDQLKEDMLKGLLLSLGHAKEVIIREFCLEEGKLVLVDNDGKPLEKVDYPANLGNDERNEMASFLASKPMGVGYGSKASLELWRESNVDDDYEPYDDGIYEDYSFALSRLEAKGFISPSNFKVADRISPISSDSDSDRDSNERGDSNGDSEEILLDDGVEVEGGLVE
ncbi:hypothetical protein Tco_1108103 [Tanacetum coccineum]